MWIIIRGVKISLNTLLVYMNYVPFRIAQIQMGYRIKLLRETAGISQEALALNANIDRTYISQLERGISNPSLLVLTKLAKELGTTVSELTNLSHPG